MSVNSKQQIIMGVDPGTNILGYSIISSDKNTIKILINGVIQLKKTDDHFIRLGIIYTRLCALIKEYQPTAMAIEAPFFGKNVQSMLKLGRAQGTAISAALSRDIPIFEYAPLKIKMSITGNGQASKEQVAGMLQRILHISKDNMLPQLDATDGLAAALCHFLQSNNPVSDKKYSGWKDFIAKNPGKVKE